MSLTLLLVTMALLTLSMIFTNLAYESKPSEQLKIENDYGGNVPMPQGEAHKIGLTNNVIYTPAETINSVSSNFRRAENVMSGRVQKNILDAMGV